MTKPNDDNLKKLGKKLSELARLELKNHAAKRNPLSPASAEPVTISQLVAEGDRIIQKEAEEQVRKMSTAEESSSQNPYARARINILKKMPEWRRKDIAEMEKTGDLNNHMYDLFVKEVEKEGDLLGDKIS